MISIAPENWKEVEPVNPGVHSKWKNEETGNSVLVEGGGSVAGQSSTYRVTHHGLAGSEIIEDEIPTKSQAESRAESWMRSNPQDKPGERGKNRFGHRF